MGFTEPREDRPRSVRATRDPRGVRPEASDGAIWRAAHRAARSSATARVMQALEAETGAARRHFRPGPRWRRRDRGRRGVRRGGGDGGGCSRRSEARGRWAQVRGYRDGWLPGRRRARWRDPRPCPRGGGSGDTPGTRERRAGRADAPTPRSGRPGRAGVPEQGAARQRPGSLATAPLHPGPPWGQRRRSCGLALSPLVCRAPGLGDSEGCAAAARGGRRHGPPGEAHAGSQGRSNFEWFCCFSFVCTPSVSSTLATLICVLRLCVCQIVFVRLYPGDCLPSYSCRRPAGVSYF